MLLICRNLSVVENIPGALQDDLLLKTADVGGIALVTGADGGITRCISQWTTIVLRKAIILV